MPLEDEEEGRRTWGEERRRGSGRSGRSGRTRMRLRRGRQRRTAALVVALALRLQAAWAVGTFEVQIHQVQNAYGLLQDGECCDGRSVGGSRCSPSDQCDTFFRACLKEYQVRVAPTGTCTFGTGSTAVLGGNSFSLRHHGHGGGGENSSGRIAIPFKYAWPKSFSLVLEALDHDNETSESAQEELIERVLLSSMLNPGEQWQTFRHHGRQLSLEYRLRFRCDANYYGPLCNKFCRSRDDFFGHYSCDAGGNKVCMEGWTGTECLEAACRQGCHRVHGFCSLPGECKCHYGWQGPLCDQCVTFPGCVHGSCTEPWKCVCDTNWGGLLCDKDLNYCGTHQPCKNGGTCANTEPNEYQCLCQEGFRGRNCDIVEHACLSNPCKNGGTCVEDPSGFSCICADGWTGQTCALAMQPCASDPCGRGATCQELPQGFQCLCPPGWSGRTCQLDTNECEAGVCVNARVCRNLIGGYLCDCLPGWTGPRCDIRNTSCQSRCLNGGHCEDSPSGFKCHCLPGFSGKLCQVGPSACDSSPCLHGGQCLELQSGGVLCHCPLGYTGLHCEVAMDECDPNPCQQGVPCHTTEGGYVCACPEGYHGSECMTLKDPCHGQHCSGAMSDPGGGGINFYMVLVGVLALLTAAGCLGCVLLLSQLHKQRQKQQTQQTTQDEGINNQRECVTLIRNLDRTVPLKAARPASPTPCLSEEIELTHPPSPAPTGPDPTLKPTRGAKLDISNREREKLNRFHYADSQELEV
ncbi:protein jagged-2 [Scleropages formosus]|uniref:protein jagged-2 n=1 Tax=Scleropages formosus TaxID=113540 RepID=UPI0010FA864D|nr:protein jagged-2-like [Scleropages formosus]